MKSIIIQENKMITRITLSGFAGSGKSTIGKNIQNELDFEFISVGNFSRTLAKTEYGMTINEFQEECERKPALDRIIDEKFQTKCNETENIVVDYRLGFKFVKTAFHVLLKVSDEIAVARIYTANRNDEETSISAIKTRNDDMQKRFIEAYNVDFTNEDHYNLIVDTDKMTSQEVTNLILRKFKKFNQTKKS